MCGNAIMLLMKAVSDNPGVTVSEMRGFLDRKTVAQRQRNEALWRQASQDAEAIIRMIIETFKPKAIYQWGSVLGGRQFSEISDIDIAVEGLGSAERYFAMLGEAERLTHFPLDLVEMEHVEPEYAELIRKHGRCVYARQENEE